MQEEKKEVVLNEKLQTLLDKVGNTPIDEPELYKALSLNPQEGKIKPDKKKVLELLLKDSTLNILDFKAIEMAELFNAVRTKITSFKDENGYFKSTPNTEKMRLPNFLEVDELDDKLNEITKLSLSLQTEDYSNTSLNDEFIKITDELSKLTWQIAGLDKSQLTDWEQLLVVEQIFACVTEVERTALGKL